MASIEFIQKRIEGKEKELAKLEKKMERIRKAEATNWEKNPYYYCERDIRITEKDIATARKALDDYRQQLVAETEKANSRNITAIIEFLDAWKTRVKECYVEAVPRYIEARTEYYRLDKEFCEWFNYQRRESTPEEREQRRKENRKMREEFESTWKWIRAYMNRDALNIEKLQKDLDREADAKYDFIIERTNAITGTITDASNLRVGAKGDLNGYIIGERGTAKVQTIGAGGYNIQCYHFRTLINKMKEQ